MTGLSECECGQELPVHLAELGALTHTCSCRRVYQAEAGAFRLVSRHGSNPVADHDENTLVDEDGNEADDEPDWSRECFCCGDRPVHPITDMCGPCTFGEAATVGGNW